jgi:hypothetical protein
MERGREIDGGEWQMEKQRESFREIDAESPRWGEKVRENERLMNKDIRTHSIICRLIIYENGY